MSWLLLLGLAVNLMWLVAHPPGPESGETAHWWPIISSLVHGQGYDACFPEYFPGCSSHRWPTAAREPIPIFLFAAVAALTGESLLAASFVQVLIDVLVLLALLLLAKEIAGDRLALRAGLFWIFYLPALKLIPQVSGELVAGLGVVSGLFFYLRARRGGRLLHWLAAGMSLALASLSRSSSLCIILALVALNLADLRLAITRRFVSSGAFVLGAALTLMPWVVRNYTTLGTPFVGSTLTGYNLYRENYQLGSSHYLRFVAGEEAGRALNDLVRKNATLRRAANEVEMESIYRGQGLEIIRHHPRKYLLLSGYRFLSLWFGWGYLQAYGVHPRLADYLVMIEQALFLLLGIVGLIRLGGKALPLGASVGAVCFAHMAVIGQLRFLVPVMPLVMILTTAGMAALMGWKAEDPPGSRSL